MNNHAIDYFSKKKKDVLTEAVPLIDGTQEPLDIEAKDRSPQAIAEAAFLFSRAQILLAEAIARVRAREAKTRKEDERKKAEDHKKEQGKDEETEPKQREEAEEGQARAEPSEPDGSPRDGTTAPYRVDILIRYKYKNHSSPEIARETGLTDNAVRARAGAAGTELQGEFRECLREEGMTEEQIDDETKAFLGDSVWAWVREAKPPGELSLRHALQEDEGTRLPGNDVLALTRAAAASPVVHEDLDCLAGLSSHELWDAADEHWQRAGLDLECLPTFLSKAWAVSKLTVDRWRRQSDLSEQSRRRLAAMSELLALITGGQLPKVSAYDLRGLVGALRGLPGSADKKAVDEVLELLTSQLEKSHGSGHKEKR